VSPILSIQGDEAVGSWCFLIKSVPPPGAPVGEILGNYQDRYRKTQSGWKIQESISGFFMPPT
jgi:hypothetical protein